MKTKWMVFSGIRPIGNYSVELDLHLGRVGQTKDLEANKPRRVSLLGTDAQSVTHVCEDLLQVDLLSQCIRDGSVITLNH